jgi:hypothetical protein
VIVLAQKLYDYCRNAFGQVVVCLGIEQGVLYHVMYIMSAAMRQHSCLGFRHFIKTSLSISSQKKKKTGFNTIQYCRYHPSFSAWFLVAW